MVAVIGDSNNHVSIDFHTRMGFVQAGVIKSIGFKHGRCLDVQRHCMKKYTRMIGDKDLDQTSILDIYPASCNFLSLLRNVFRSGRQ